MKKILALIAFSVCGLMTIAQTNQYYWYQGNLMMGNVIAQIDSVTFGGGEQTDTLHILLPRTVIKTAEFHDTVRVVVHDTIYIRQCPDAMVEAWNGFKIESMESNTKLLFETMEPTSSDVPGELYYSQDAQNWIEWHIGDTVNLSGIGSVICVKGTSLPIHSDGYQLYLRVVSGEAKGYGYINSIFENGDIYTKTVFGNGSITNFFQGKWNITLSLPEGVTQLGTSYIYSYPFCNRNEALSAGIRYHYGYTAVELPSTLTYIGCTCFEEGAFSEITIPRGVTYIGNAAFNRCTLLTTVNYLGTMSEWNNISKGNYKWENAVPATVVHCTDGDAPF